MGVENEGGRGREGAGLLEKAVEGDEKGGKKNVSRRITKSEKEPGWRMSDRAAETEDEREKREKVLSFSEF